MTKKKRSVFMTVLAGAMLVAASGSEAGGTATAAQGSDPEVELAQGVTDDRIVLGTSQPMTGAVAVLNEALRAGLQIAIDEVNDAGGIDGRQVELITYDSAREAARSVANIRRLVVEDQVFGLLSPSGSTELEGSWRLIEEEGIPVWAPIYPPDPQLPSVYLLNVQIEEQVRVMIDYLASQGVERVAYIGEDTALGQQNEDGLDQIDKYENMELVATERVDAETENVSSPVLKLLESEPEAVIMGASINISPLIIQELDKADADVIIMSNGGQCGVGGPSVVEPAGDGAEGLICTLTTQLPDADIPEVEAWRTAAEALGGNSVDSLGLTAYAFAKGFMQVLDEMDGELTWEKFNEVAESTEMELGAIPTVACGPLPDGHQCVTGSALAQYSDGAWSVIQDFTEAE